MMRKIFLFTFPALLALISCGCNSLPDGTPPEGAIVGPSRNDRSALNRREAVNYMITSLTMRCRPVANAAKAPDVTKEFKCTQPEMNALPEEVFRGVQKMSMLRVPSPEAKAEYRLESEIVQDKNNTVWKMRFVSADGQKEFWSETVQVEK